MQSFNFLLVNIVGFGCQLGYRVYMSWVSTDPSCTQIGQFLLIFFLALRWGANPSKYRSGEKNPQNSTVMENPKTKKVLFWLKLSFFLHLNYIVYTIYKLYKKSDNLVIQSPQRLARWKHKLNPLSQEILQKLFFLSIIAKRLKRRPNRFSNLLQALSLSTSLV